jgi:Mn-dependent DtxR family transcriptional regulator
LINHTDEDISAQTFKQMMARLEKRSFISFVSRLHAHETKKGDQEGELLFEEDLGLKE